MNVRHEEACTLAIKQRDLRELNGLEVTLFAISTTPRRWRVYVKQGTRCLWGAWLLSQIEDEPIYLSYEAALAAGIAAAEALIESL